MDYVVNDLKAKDPKIGICYQEDEWGKDGLQGVEMACKKYGLAPPTTAPYKRGTKSLSAEVMKLKTSGVTHCFYVGYALFTPPCSKKPRRSDGSRLSSATLFLSPRTFIAEDAADGIITSLAGA